MTIVLKRRAHDWHICLKERPEVWECAINREEAIGKLMVTLAALGMLPEGLRFASEFNGEAQR